MKVQACDRWGAEEYIPTHQYVKFEGEIRYLCARCWQRLHRWWVRRPEAPGEEEKP